MTSLAVHRASDVVSFGRELTELALGGAGWPVLLDRLATESGRTCRLVAPDGTLLAATDGGPGLLTPAAVRAAHGVAGVSVNASDGWAARAIPERAGGRLHAMLLMAEPLREWQVELAVAAGTALLIESVRRGAEGAARFDTGAAVIAALRTGRSDAGTITAAAARFGTDLTKPGSAAVVRYTGRALRTWTTALSWLARAVQQQGRDAYCLVSGEDDLQRVRSQLERVVGPGSVQAACGFTAQRPAHYRDSFRTAQALIAHLPPSAEQLTFADAGLLQVLLAVPRDRLEYFVQRHLGPVLARPELLETLQLWLETHGSRRLVSERLHLHRNSIGYRVGQLKVLLGADPLDPAVGAVLQAALIARTVLAGDGQLPAVDTTGEAP